MLVVSFEKEEGSVDDGFGGAADSELQSFRSWLRFRLRDGAGIGFDGDPAISKLHSSARQL